MSAAPKSSPGFFGLLEKFTILIATTSLSSLVLILFWQVVGRYVFNNSPGWTEPMALTLMSVAALFGAALAVRNEAHFSFPILVESSPAPIKLALKSLARLIALLFGAALAYYGTILVIDGWDISMAGAPLPEGFAFIGVAAGGALIAAFALERLLYGDAPREEEPALEIDTPPAATKEA